MSELKDELGITQNVNRKGLFAKAIRTKIPEGDVFLRLITRAHEMRQGRRECGKPDDGLTKILNILGDVRNAMIDRVREDEYDPYNDKLQKVRLLIIDTLAYRPNDDAWRDLLSMIDETCAKSGITRLPGRPREIEKVVRISVYLDEESREIARDIGEGNISAGIRLALKSFKREE